MRFLTLRVFVLLRRLTKSVDKGVVCLSRIADSLDSLVAASQPKPKKTPTQAMFDSLDVAAAEARWMKEKERMEQGLGLDE